MKKVMVFFAVCLAMCLSAISSFAVPVGRGNALVNGGFETGDLIGWTTSNNTWSVATGSDTVSGYLTVPTEGQSTVRCYGSGSNSLNNNWLSQTVNVVNVMDLYFDYCVFLPDYPPYEQPGFKVDLILGGITDTIFAVNDSAFGTQQIGWETFSYDLSGYTGDLGLTFYCGNTIDGVYTPWVYIDNVGVNTIAPVPEPCTMLLLGTGLVGIAGVSQQKKRKRE